MTSMSIAILAAGAGGMYCGSCLRDSALAGALKRAGQRVTLVPMYTPLKTEEATDGNGEIFFGGVNVYLQHALALFRRTPRSVDWLLDRRAVLKLAGRLGTQTPPARLGPITLSILRGEEGPTVKELRRLIEFLSAEVRPQVISLPNLMFIGLARSLRKALGAAIVCELTGEDLFLDAMSEPDRTRCQRSIRERVGDASALVATSGAYADRMGQYLGIERERIAVVHPGVPSEYVTGGTTTKATDHPFSSAQGRAPTIGYVARVCREKGFERLIEAMEVLHRMTGMGNVRLVAGGYVSPSDRRWLAGIIRRAKRWAPPGAIRYVGELDRTDKLRLLDRIDVFSVPTTYREAKGIYVLEAMSRGVPAVQPNHGSFPELIEATGGGVLVPPNDARALAEAIAGLLRDPARREQLGAAGRNAVRERFTDDHMAQRMLEVYRDTLERERAKGATPAQLTVGGGA
jgi:glycosyltransferase involved in cell wall biosynthesis